MTMPARDASIPAPPRSMMPALLAQWVMGIRTPRSPNKARKCRYRSSCRSVWDLSVSSARAKWVNIPRISTPGSLLIACTSSAADPSGRNPMRPMPVSRASWMPAFPRAEPVLPTSPAVPVSPAVSVSPARFTLPAVPASFAANLRATSDSLSACENWKTAGSRP